MSVLTVRQLVSAGSIALSAQTDGCHRTMDARRLQIDRSSSLSSDDVAAAIALFVSPSLAYAAFTGTAVLFTLHEGAEDSPVSRAP